MRAGQYAIALGRENDPAQKKQGGTELNRSPRNLWFRTEAGEIGVSWLLPCRKTERLAEAVLFIRLRRTAEGP